MDKKKIIRKQPAKKIVTFLGKEIKYRYQKELEQKMKLPKNIVNVIKNNDIIPVIIVDKNKDIGKENLKMSPVFLRQFNIKNIAKKKITELLTTTTTTIKKSEIVINDVYDSDQAVNLTIKYTVNLVINMSFDETTTRRRIIPLLVRPSEIMANVDDDIRAMFTDIIDECTVQVIAGVRQVFIEIFSTKTKQSFNLIDGKLRNSKPYDISSIFSNVEINDNKDCAKSYILSKLKKMTKFMKNEVEKLGNSEGVTTSEIINFCQKYSIECYAYDRSSILLSSHIPEIRLPNSRILNFLAYNNHLYPIQNKYLETREKEAKTLHIMKKEDFNKLLNNTLENNIMPSEVQYNGDFIYSFVINTNKYIYNDDYLICKAFLDKVGLSDKIYDSITIISLFAIIEKKEFNDKNIDSFFPVTLKKQAINYTHNIQKKSNVCKIDKNLCYLNALNKLPFVITCDIRTSKITQNPTEIIDHHLYLCAVESYTELLPSTNIYVGYHLKYCQIRNIKFTLLTEWQCEKIDNHYKNVTECLYNNLERKTLKTVYTRSIGKFASEPKIKHIYNVEGIYNNDYITRKSGHIHKIIDDNNLLFNVSEKVMNAYNKKPIHIQLMDMSRQILHEKMVSMKLKESDILEIHTDSITYYGKYPTKLNDKTMDGWKKLDNDKVKFDDFEVEDVYLNSTYNDICQKNKFDKNKIYQSMAGSGKSTHIKKLVENKKDYIILTPSHTSLKDYRDLKLNCDVIQKYSLSRTVPKESYIICDEIGMFSKKDHDTIYRCAILNKSIRAYGDFDQLKPVDSSKKTYNKQAYIQHLFKKQSELTENYRNDFTREFYQSLIDSYKNITNEEDKIEINKQLVLLVKQYSTLKPEDAEIIISYRNETAKLNNDKMLLHYNLTNNSVSVPIICTTNKLQSKKIYKGFIYKITKNEDNIIELDGLYTISKKEFDKYFLTAYCINIHKLQGSDFKSIHYCEEDYGFIDNTVAYVVLSRIKTKNFAKIIKPNKDDFMFNLL